MPDVGGQTSCAFNSLSANESRLPSVGGSGRQTLVVVFDQRLVAVGGVAVAQRSGSVVAELRLQLPRKLDLDLSKRIDHLVLQRLKLRRIAEGVRVYASKLVDRAVQVLCKVGVL